MSRSTCKTQTDPMTNKLEIDKCKHELGYCVLMRKLFNFKISSDTKWYGNK